MNMLKTMTLVLEAADMKSRTPTVVAMVESAMAMRWLIRVPTSAAPIRLPGVPATVYSR